MKMGYYKRKQYQKPQLQPIIEGTMLGCFDGTLAGLSASKTGYQCAAGNPPYGCNPTGIEVYGPLPTCSKGNEDGNQYIAGAGYCKDGTARSETGSACDNGINVGI